MKAAFPLLLLVVISTLSGLYLGGVFTPHPGDGALTQLNVSADCVGTGNGCEARGPQGRTIGFSTAANAHPMRPFDVSIRLAGFKEPPARVELSFRMSDMYMGDNRYSLSRAPDGSWSGRVILPICTTRRLDWLVDVSLGLADETVTASFPLRLGLGEDAKAR